MAFTAHFLDITVIIQGSLANASLVMEGSLYCIPVTSQVLPNVVTPVLEYRCTPLWKKKKKDISL